MISKQYSCSTLTPDSRGSEDSRTDSSDNKTRSTEALLYNKSEAFEEDKVTRASARAKFESIRATVKKLSLTTLDQFKSFPTNSYLPPKIMLSIRSRVADAELEEFSENFMDFTTNYKISETIGEGTTGIVKKCIDLRTGEELVVKITRTNDVEVLKTVKSEFCILKSIPHPNIVEAKGLYYNSLKSCLYLVQEMVQGSDLAEFLVRNGRCYEPCARDIFRQILDAINYMHSKGVCHRDIKPQNIMLEPGELKVKIADFNVSKNFEVLTKMATHTGTTAFSAPEMLCGEEYNEKVDIWSAGAVLYTMLAGYQPFDDINNNMGTIVDMIRRGEYDVDTKVPWTEISTEAKDLVKKLMEPDPNNRISAREALEHPWMVLLSA